MPLIGIIYIYIHINLFYDFICFLFFVQDVVTSLRDKLCLNADEHFSLVLEHVKSLKRNKLTLLDPDETLARVRATTTYIPNTYFLK